VESNRYSRQSRFWAIGGAGQERLRAGRVLVIGCGGLGSAAVDLLARAGVGQITIVDRDFVELSNLQRQLLFDEADAAAGTPKAIAAARAVARINSEVEVRPFVADLTPTNVERFVAQADVVLDGTDNLDRKSVV
jgi:adenylyltransferase/sulfurtransferase